ncbi:MAG: adenosylcobinamide-GDP ribazoletransferase [Anaerolineae bacterium]|nr:adenosylcobinamide-GDP ribazoletransferase [Anaerolineae bacterium]MDW8071165.1 adenosylcobinamide-GDP ribazoletransferase [Anaerolineae bacterium]
MRGLWAALRFLTTIPVPERWLDEASLAPRAMLGWWGVVGGLIGALAAAIVWVAHFRLPWSACAALGLVISVVLSGGLHLDGFADTCDGMGARAPRERALAIMKDARIGAFGVIGIVCLLLLKFGLLAGLAPSRGIAALGCVPAAGRLAQVWVLHRYNYARAEGGMAGAFFAATTRGHLVVTALVAIAVAFAWSQLPGVTALAWAMGWGGLSAAWIAHWLQGHTGDTVGAVSELTEVAMLLGLAIIPEIGA